MVEVLYVLVTDLSYDFGIPIRHCNREGQLPAQSTGIAGYYGDGALTGHICGQGQDVLVGVDMNDILIARGGLIDEQVAIRIREADRDCHLSTREQGLCRWRATHGRR